ncbi:carboxylating nicotinate-nucleotide diphosphorylase [Geminicoccus flavidas]|uniref:carboxylating nicotinate-nucleotide diphosphorylase n=1 Tax=Geminicoccus flavidas TaxID=2506407 RepID=UPI001359B7BF|nr:carboxylating nicotinate-nucleotide diphosphorylase [Geminicoccus flavidas]
MIDPLPTLLVEPVIRAALLEDLGRAGDITTMSVVPAEARMRCHLAARQQGRLAGIEVAKATFRLIEPAIHIETLRSDGDPVEAGQPVLLLDGSARAILTAERTALNLASRLSGIATATAAMVAAVRPHKARITCTRKTTPGLRALEKQAIRAGGGLNHRFGLDDAILIKDNHIAIAGGVAVAIERAKQMAGHLVKIEVEVDTIGQLEEAMRVGVDAVLLDNMAPSVLAEAVRMVAGRAITEASGRVSPATVHAIAASGVDLISVGWLTHSAPILDLGLDVLT